MLINLADGVDVNFFRVTDAIADYRPHVTVSVIREYQVHDKTHARLPDQVEGVLRCPNPNCITA